MPDPLDVPVTGGTLRVAAWSGIGGPVLAIHGITSSSRTWPFVAAALDRPLFAPDLRGRGRSNHLAGPAGIAQHADDCAAVVEATGGVPLVVVGHSMGGFVATVLAARRPDLVRGLVLVDGGLPFAAADEAATLAGLQPIKQRLLSTYTRESYRDWFRNHPAFARDWTPEAEAYADYDLPESPGRPSADPDIVEADQVDMVHGAAFREALAQPLPPRVFLHAPRGFADDPPGLYPQPVVDEYAARWPDVDVRPVPDVNHYTIVLSSRGAAAIAQAVRDLG
ncbi:MAG TPA: alpha/beta fold hydrolase [Nocardioides sp.]|jgi:pimeloyl-ACP methyl ester carboxylesterase|nr:alpha/beta fold hydrolase [Nocardioides sp.]